MDETSPAQRVIRYRLTAAIAEQRIREFAAVSDNIKWSAHALMRMDEREIFDNDVLRILRRGMIGGDPEETPQGEWKCKMALRLRGTREAGVVVIILKRGGLLVKTVEWEDLR
jgi:predicted sugar kinase